MAFIGGEEKELLLEAELPYHRLLLHGLSQVQHLIFLVNSLICLHMVYKCLSKSKN